MYDFSYEALLRDARRFDETKTSYSFVEATSDLDSPTHQVREGTMSEAEILDWINEPTQAGNQCRLKIIRTKFAVGRVSCSSGLFKGLQQRWSLPNCMLYGLIHSESFPQMLSHPLGATLPTSIGVLCSLAPSFQMFWTYEIPTKTCFMFYSYFRDGDTLIADWLRKAPEAVRHPGVLPLLLLEEAFDTHVAMGISYSQTKTVEEAVRLGLLSDADPGVALDEAALNQATRNMTFALQNVSLATLALERLEAMLNALGEFIDQIQAGQNLETHPKELNVEISQRMTAMRARIQGAKCWNLLSKERGQAWLPTVYCLISTLDNKNNIQATKASLKIAEESRRIADDSKGIAILTRRDSNDMRIIAAVTLLFLPGTFVATLFSTSFLNFLPDPDTERVSGLGLGLYWACTITLTLLVLGSWVTVSRKQSAKDAEKFEVS